MRQIDINIKYRAWSKKSNLLQSVTIIDFIDHKIWCGLEELEYGQYELMAFTGLLDKASKEIYAGDKVRKVNYADETIEATVEWFVTKFILRFEDGIFEDMIGSDLLEIIGNVYEGRLNENN